MTETLITSSVLIAVVLILRTIFKGKLSSRARYALWLIVAARLLLPFGLIQSSASLMNYIKPAEEEIIPVQQVPDVQVPFEVPVTPAPDFDFEPTTGEILLDSGMTMEVPKPVSPASEAKPEISAEQLIKIIWVGGSAAMAMWFLGINALFYAKLRRSRKPVDYPCPLRVYEVKWLNSPCIFGLFRPAIYITDSTADKETLDFVIAHEYCHYLHGDMVWSVLRYILLAIYWFDPLVWAAAILSKRDCECACDEAAIKRLGEEKRLDYGRALIRMIPKKGGAFGVASTSMSAGGKAIKERIKMISEKPKIVVAAVIVTVIAVALAAVCTFTSAKTKQPEPTEPPVPENEILDDIPEDDANVPDVPDEPINTYKTAQMMNVDDIEQGTPANYTTWVGFSIPEDWTRSGTAAFKNGKKTMELGLVYRDSQELPREWFTTGETEVTILEEDHPGEGLYSDLYHVSMPSFEEAGSTYEIYEYVVDRSGYSLLVIFVVNEYFDIDTCEKVLESIVIAVNGQYSADFDVYDMDQRVKTEFKARVGFILPAGWDMPDTVGFNEVGEKVMEMGLVYFADQNLPREWFTTADEFETEVVVFEEEHDPDGEIYTDMYHLSKISTIAPEPYEIYVYVVNRVGYKANITFVVNDGFNREVCENILKTMDILALDRIYSNLTRVIAVSNKDGDSTDEFAVANFVLPQTWKMESFSTGYLDAFKMITFKVYEDYDIDYEELKTPKHLITVLEEEVREPYDEAYSYMIRRIYKYKDKDEEWLTYIMRRKGFEKTYLIKATFYVNERFDEAAISRFIKSLTVEEYNEPDGSPETINAIIGDALKIERFYDVEPPEYDFDDAKEWNGRTYYRVTDENYDTWQEWEKFIRATYTETLADNTLTRPDIVSIGGKTYCNGGGRGTDLRNDFTCEVSLNFRNEMQVSVKIPYAGDEEDNGCEERMYSLVYTVDGWRVESRIK